MTTEVKNDKCPIQAFLESTREFYIEQIHISTLNQFSYYIESDNNAAIIDPIRDIERYLELLSKRNSKLKYIFVTHLHSDFVSGYFDLARITNSLIVYGENSISYINEYIKTSFYMKFARDNEEFNLGNITFRLLKTPGHTKDSVCLLLIDRLKIQKVLFSGDTLLLDDIGRPESFLFDDVSEDTLFTAFYETLEKLSLLVNDNVIVFPGHSTGATCGRKIAAGIGDYFSNQKVKNWALNLASKSHSEEFFKKMAQEQSSNKLFYFYLCLYLNKTGYLSLDQLLKFSNNPINFETFEVMRRNEDVTVIDTRDHTESLKRFIRGTIIIPLKQPCETFVAKLIPYTNKVILITDIGKENEAISRLARVGFHNVVGYLNGGIEEYANKSVNNFVSCVNRSPNEVLELTKKIDYDILDIRERNELVSSGIIKSAKCIALSSINNPSTILELKKIKKPLGIYCRSGLRACIFASYLKKYDYDGIIENFGGFENLKNAGMEFTKFE